MNNPTIHITVGANGATIRWPDINGVIRYKRVPICELTDEQLTSVDPYCLPKYVQIYLHLLNSGEACTPNYLGRKFDLHLPSMASYLKRFKKVYQLGNGRGIKYYHKNHEKTWRDKS